MDEYQREGRIYRGGWQPLAECVKKLASLGDRPVEAYVTPEAWNEIVQFFQQAMPLCIRIGTVHMLPETGVVLRVMGQELLLHVDATHNDRCMVVGERNTTTFLHDPDFSTECQWTELDKEKP